MRREASGYFSASQAKYARLSFVPRSESANGTRRERAAATRSGFGKQSNTIKCGRVEPITAAQSEDPSSLCSACGHGRHSFGSRNDGSGTAGRCSAASSP
jgi:hypothetical protein